jgi:hypothetical protein
MMQLSLCWRQFMGFQMGMVDGKMIDFITLVIPFYKVPSLINLEICLINLAGLAGVVQGSLCDKSVLTFRG